MTEELNQNNTPDELTALKDQADTLGISYHPSIGAEKLRDKITAALAAQPPAPVVPEPGVVPEVPEAPAETEGQMRTRKKQEAAKLIRVSIACMNPNKREWEGELITAGNNLVPSMTKFIPFDVEYHVPQIILSQLEARQCQVFITKKDARGNKSRQGKLIKEFSIERLEPLTEAELKDLAQRQAMAAGTSE